MQPGDLTHVLHFGMILAFKLITSYPACLLTVISETNKEDKKFNSNSNLKATVSVFPIELKRDCYIISHKYTISTRCC